jgi:hypothetical protein
MMTPIPDGMTTAPLEGAAPPQVPASDHAPDRTARTPAVAGANAFSAAMSDEWWAGGAVISWLMAAQETRAAPVGAEGVEGDGAGAPPLDLQAPTKANSTAAKARPRAAFAPLTN